MRQRRTAYILDSLDDGQEARDIISDERLSRVQVADQEDALCICQVVEERACVYEKGTIWLAETATRLGEHGQEELEDSLQLIFVER